MRAEYQNYRDELRRLIENEKLTQEQIAARWGKDRTTIQRWCYRFGLVTQRSGPRSGAQHTGWKGGRRLVGGYWYVYAPDHPLATKQQYVLEHRLVIEDRLGRYLLPTEVVHHIDGNRQNNAPENLMVFARNSEHLRYELIGRVPKWTLEGRERTLQGVRKGNRNRQKSKRDDRPHTRTNDRPPW
jgi:hypothetical protein